MAKKKTTSPKTFSEAKRRAAKAVEATVTDESAAYKDGRLKNLRQETFCELYATHKEFFGNGVQSYIEAFDVDISEKGAYHSARQLAYRLLTKVHILKRIDELLELGPLNETTVDKQLAFLVEQNAELATKLGAIREFNKLKGRITDKLEAKIETEMTEEQANAVIERYLAKERDFEQSSTSGGDQGKAKPPRAT